MLRTNRSADGLLDVLLPSTFGDQTSLLLATASVKIGQSGYCLYCLCASIEPSVVL